MTYVCSRKLAPPRRPISLLCALSACVAGCSTVGPVSIPLDRFNYNQATAQSANEQLLLNIIRLRYGEPFCWVEIGTMLSQYTFQAGADFTGWEYNINRWASPELRAAFGVRPDPVPTDRWGANFGWSDRPTITYQPLQGEEFARRVMTPIPATTLIYLAQSGWSVDQVFECCVQQLNGLQNRPIHDVTAGSWVSSLQFRTVTALLKRIQDSGYLRFSFGYDVEDKSTYLYPPAAIPGLEKERKELSELLGISEDVQRIKVVETGYRRVPDEFSIETRSLHGVMYALSQTFAPPDEHVERGWVVSAFKYSDEEDEQPEQENDSSAWLDIRHSRLPAPNAFTQVFYSGYWFYIPKSDWRSKRTFALLTYLFSLQATEAGKGPLVTIPAGGQ